MIISAPRNWSHKEYSCFDFRHIHYLHLMYSEVVWVLVSSGTQARPQIILDPEYLPNYLPVSYDYGNSKIHAFKKPVFWKNSRNSHKRSSSSRSFLLKLHFIPKWQWVFSMSSKKIFRTAFLLKIFQITARKTLSKAASLFPFSS